MEGETGNWYSSQPTNSINISSLSKIQINFDSQPHLARLGKKNKLKVSSPEAFHSLSGAEEETYLSGFWVWTQTGRRPRAMKSPSSPTHGAPEIAVLAAPVQGNGGSWEGYLLLLH